MANESRFTGNTGALTIDYQNEKIIFERDRTVDSQHREYAVPFSDITGIEFQQPISKLLKKSFGGVHFIVQGKRLVNKKPYAAMDPILYDATDLYFPDTNEFNRLSQELTNLAKNRNIPIGSKGSNKVGFVFVDEYLDSGSTEIRKLCNVCGKVFCYSKVDLLKNRVLEEKAKGEHSAGVAQSLFTSQLTGNQLLSRAQQTEAQIVDYSKCPNCGSTNLKELSKEEFEQLNAPKSSSGNNNTVSSASVADELKKFKELLDLGAITQEEFDAKKKQLLGL